LPYYMYIEVQKQNWHRSGYLEICHSGRRSRNDKDNVQFVHFLQSNKRVSYSPCSKWAFRIPWRKSEVQDFKEGKSLFDVIRECRWIAKYYFHNEITHSKPC